MSKRSLSAEYKLEILKVYEVGHHSITELASMYKVDWSSIMAWKYSFEKYGAEGLKEASSNKKYSKELKLAAIQDYQSGQYSIREVIRKYEISSTSVLRKCDFLKKRSFVHIKYLTGSDSQRFRSIHDK